MSIMDLALNQKSQVWQVPCFSNPRFRRPVIPVQAVITGLFAILLPPDVSRQVDDSGYPCGMTAT